MPWLSARIVPSFVSVFVFTTAGAAGVVVVVEEFVASVVAVDTAFLLEPELPHAPSVSPTPTMTATAPPREVTETPIDPPHGSTLHSPGITKEAAARIARHSFLAVSDLPRVRGAA